MCTRDLMIAGQIFILIYLSKCKSMKAMNISIRLNSAFQWLKVGQPWDYTMSYCLHFFQNEQNYLKFIHRTLMRSHSN